MHFLKFIARRCSPLDRHDYLDALSRMQPGIRGETQRDNDDDLSQMKGVNVMPNIRLANGLVRQETRQRLMLAFNTPFFPEVLVASSVLAEGVDPRYRIKALSQPQAQHKRSRRTRAQIAADAAAKAARKAARATRAA